MKATGIVRRIDDLGRVVVPKEIRRTMRIREGEPMEIFTGREGEIVLKKYSPVGEYGRICRIFAELLAQNLGMLVGISDHDQFIAATARNTGFFWERVSAERWKRRSGTVRWHLWKRDAD